MHDEDLKMIWVCDNCKFDFIFHSDVEMHKHETGHLTMEKFDLSSTQVIEN